MKKYSSDIEEIHRTVDSACSEKLTEARTILSDCENKGKAIESMPGWVYTTKRCKLDFTVIENS